MAEQRTMTLDYKRVMETLGPDRSKWAAALFATSPISYLLAPYLALPAGLYALYAKAGSAIFDYIKDQGTLSRDDAQNISTILDAGKRAGLEELVVEIDKERFEGLRAKGVVPQAGVAVEFGAGAAGSGKYTVRAKYRDVPAGR